jgi:hypothetical protein
MGFLKVEKCKLDEIVPKKPKFAGEDPGYFCKMDPMVFSDQKMMKDWIFGEFFESPESLSLGFSLSLSFGPISLLGDFRVPYLFFHTLEFDEKNST